MKKKRDKLLYYLLLIITIIAFVFLLRLIKVYDIICYILNLVLPILLGFIFAWILVPICNKLNAKLNHKISILIIVLFFILVYSLVGYFAVPILFKKLNSLVKILEVYLLKLKNLKILKIDENLFSMKPRDLIDSCGGLISIIINVVLIHVFGLYILYNYDLIKKYIKKKLLLKNKTQLIEFIKKLSFNMRLYIKGLCLDTLVLFIITYITFSILRLKYALLLAMFIAITNIIPFVGPYIGGIPAVLIALGKSKKLAIIIVAFLFISQEIESDIINPIIMSKCVKVNPLLVVIVVTLAGKTFGIMGMIFAVPLIIFVKLLIEFMKESKQVHNIS